MSNNPNNERSLIMAEQEKKEKKEKKEDGNEDGFFKRNAKKAWNKTKQVGLWVAGSFAVGGGVGYYYANRGGNEEPVMADVAE